MKFKPKIIVFIALLVLGVTSIWVIKNYNLNLNYKVGQKVDEFNGVAVYFNGRVGHVSGRNITEDGYNLGLKYQCVEFVKRYYYKHLIHKMPNSYGNAKSFFDTSLNDAQKNNQRGLIQYSNLSKAKPEVDDLIVFSETVFNKYGHVAIISKVTDKEIEIIQQNPGQFGPSRESFKLLNEQEKWKIDNNRVLGWLRKE